MTTTTNLRLFFAITLPDDVRQTLVNLTKQLRKEKWGKSVRWISPENLHITLHFIGHCETLRVALLCEEVSKMLKSIKSFLLQLGAVTLFPQHKNPHVIAVHVVPSNDLLKLAHAVGQGIIASGLEIEARKYLPHLSLGRFLRTTPPSIAPQTHPAIKQFLVKEIALLHSEKIDEKRIYLPMQHFSLSN